jgi:hypothetical protein
VPLLRRREARLGPLLLLPPLLLLRRGRLTELPPLLLNGLGLLPPPLLVLAGALLPLASVLLAAEVKVTAEGMSEGAV